MSVQLMETEVCVKLNLPLFLFQIYDPCWHKSDPLLPMLHPFFCPLMAS